MVFLTMKIMRVVFKIKLSFVRVHQASNHLTRLKIIFKIYFFLGFMLTQIFRTLRHYILSLGFLIEEATTFILYQNL